MDTAEPLQQVIEVGRATKRDVEDLTQLEIKLFAEDAGVHDPFADISWPEREGRQDFEGLLGSQRALVLVARLEGHPVGFLVGYLSQSSPTRRPATYAILRSLYVDSEVRRRGCAAALAEAFLKWARVNAADEAHVDHYAANTGAGLLYERLGFQPRSISRVLPLG